MVDCQVIDEKKPEEQLDYKLILIFFMVNKTIIFHKNTIK